mmetsp:Transcript_19041/g.45740  ORF Transcript_19041/g.45740 Transcript_19041/m.45740 type:complete len:126 (+) Transcript_19041:1168-1545(+)
MASVRCNRQADDAPDGAGCSCGGNSILDGIGSIGSSIPDGDDRIGIDRIIGIGIMEMGDPRGRASLSEGGPPPSSCTTPNDWLVYSTIGGGVGRDLPPVPAPGLLPFPLLSPVTTFGMGGPPPTG